MPFRNVLLALSLLGLGACAGTGGRFTSMEKTNQLEPGMTTSEVESILGGPGRTQIVEDKLVWRYALQEPWVGYVPTYLAFNKDSKTLVSWYANKDEYYRN